MSRTVAHVAAAVVALFALLSVAGPASAGPGQLGYTTVTLTPAQVAALPQYFPAHADYGNTVLRDDAQIGGSVVSMQWNCGGSGYAAGTGTIAGAPRATLIAYPHSNVMYMACGFTYRYLTSIGAPTFHVMTGWAGYPESVDIRHY